MKQNKKIIKTRTCEDFIVRIRIFFSREKVAVGMAFSGIIPIIKFKG